MSIKERFEPPPHFIPQGLVMRLSGLATSGDILNALKQFERENLERCKVHTITSKLDLDNSNFTKEESLRCFVCSNIVLYKMAQKAKIMSNSVSSSIANLIDNVPPQHDFNISNPNDCSDLVRHLSPLALISINKANKIIRLFGPENVYVSFNGGKDSTVAMHLYLCAYYCHFSQKDLSEFPKPKMIFFREEGGFEEINKFVEEMAEIYCFDLKIVDKRWEDGIKTAFDDKNNIAFIMGMRSTDSKNNDLEFLECSDLDCSSFLRVNLLKNWSYGAIWSFILHFKIPYCSLYNRGYTSIGKMNDTWPNDDLKDGPEYKPAFYLSNWENERAGRCILPVANHKAEDTSIHTIVNPLLK